MMEGLKSRMDFDDVAWEKSETSYETWEKAHLKDESTTRQIGKLIAKYRMGSPTEMYKILQGGYNVVYRMKFIDGGVAIARFPMPGVVKFPEEKVLAEVATMRYIQEHTTIPVPFVLHCGMSDESPDGFGPFIIMEWIEHETDLFERFKTPGLPLGTRPILNPELPLERIEHIYSQLADILLQLSRLKLPQIGALSQTAEDTWIVDQRPLSLQMNELVDRGDFPPEKLLSTSFDTEAAYFDALSLQMLRHFVTQPHYCMNSYLDGRRRFLARHLFRRLVTQGRIPTNKQANAGPFPLFFDDMRPSNILLSKTDRIIGVVDWEFVYAAPQGFTSSAPWWLLMDQPEYWPEDRGPWIDAYTAQLNIFLRCLEAKENEALRQGRMRDDERLSTSMRRSLDTGDFWLYYMVRRPWAFDAIYWREIDERFFGAADDVLEARMGLLDAETLSQMETLLADKAGHHNRMCDDRSTCCAEWPRASVYDELLRDEPPLVQGSNGDAGNGKGMSNIETMPQVYEVEA